MLIGVVLRQRHYVVTADLGTHSLFAAVTRSSPAAAAFSSFGRLAGHDAGPRADVDAVGLVEFALWPHLDRVLEQRSRRLAHERAVR